MTRSDQTDGPTLVSDESSASDDDRQPPTGLAGQFGSFLRDHAVWWLAPIVLVAALMVLVSLLAGKAELPFIYR